MISGRSTAASTARTVSAASSGERSPSSGCVLDQPEIHQVGAQLLHAAGPGGRVRPHVAVDLGQRFGPFGRRLVQHVQGDGRRMGRLRRRNSRNGMPSAPPMVTVRPRVPPSAFVAPMVTAFTRPDHFSLASGIVMINSSCCIWHMAMSMLNSSSGIGNRRRQQQNLARRSERPSAPGFRRGRRKTSCPTAPAGSTSSSCGTSGSRSACKRGQFALDGFRHPVRADAIDQHMLAGRSAPATRGRAPGSARPPGSTAASDSSRPAAQSTSLVVRRERCSMPASLSTTTAA